ncbi:MAG: peroxide stress protein YaaA [Bacteroidales bacterium]
MLSIISPAKTMDYTPQHVTSEHTKPVFVEEANALADILVQFSKNDLQKLMGVSEKLAELNMQRYQTWKFSGNDDAKQAVFAFHGDVFVGLHAQDLPDEGLHHLQQNLRILSGLYGVLRPFDMILPHRLEMGTSLSTPEGDNLYAFWKQRITHNIQEEISKNKHSHIINLASKEYAQAIDFSHISVPVITPVFKDFKNGKLKIISFYAKKARGMMVRYIAENNITNPKDLIGFDAEGYFYDDTMSDEHTLVFTR